MKENGEWYFTRFFHMLQKVKGAHYVPKARISFSLLRKWSYYQLLVAFVRGGIWNVAELYVQHLISFWGSTSYSTRFLLIFWRWQLIWQEPLRVLIFFLFSTSTDQSELREIIRGDHSQPWISNSDSWQHFTSSKSQRHDCVSKVVTRTGCPLPRLARIFSATTHTVLVNCKSNAGPLPGFRFSLPLHFCHLFQENSTIVCVINMHPAC
jgi:hypothetical protein